MKYTGPKARLARREGVNIFGEKLQKYVQKKNYAPGQHKKTIGKLSEYGVQLREKQKAKRMYNVTEKKFYRYYEMATKKKGENTGDLMLRFLETRFDSLLYSMGLAKSREQARQWISHKLWKLNGKRINVASYIMTPGDEFEIIDRMKSHTMFQGAKNDKNTLPAWVEFDPKTLKGKVLRLPEKDELPVDINIQMIIEFYSR